MNDLTAAVQFLSGLGATVDVGGVPVPVVVSGPLDLGEEGPVPVPTCIVQAAGPAEDERGGVPERTVSYLFRFYGPDDLAALHAHEALRLATYANYGLRVPVLHVAVAGRLLKWFTISAPTGPTPEPGTLRPTVAATGRARWAD